MRLEGNTTNPKVLVIGCFHGDEPQGKFLINKYLDKKPDTKILFIPCLNEFGVNNNVRTNKNGVDLNRNFPTKNWIKSEKDNFYGGEKPASEEETVFIINTIKRYKPKAIITLHAPYKVVNYDGNAKTLAETISKIINYPIEENIGYPTPGSFGTWAGIESGIPTITLELDEEIDIELLEKPVSNIFDMLESY